MYVHTKKLAWVGSGENPPGTKKMTKIYGTKKNPIFAKNAFFRIPFFDNVANHPRDNMEREEVKRDVEAELGEMKARNEELHAEVEVLRAKVRALQARNEAQVRRANDAWRQIRAILGYALRPVEA